MCACTLVPVCMAMRGAVCIGEDRPKRDGEGITKIWVNKTEFQIYFCIGIFCFIKKKSF